MSFIDLRFLVFFPTVTALFILFPKRFRWALLLVASYLFYMAWKPEYGLLLLTITAIDYFVGLALASEERPQVRHAYLLISLCANLGILFIFKYFNFMFASIEEVFRFAGSSATFPVLSLLLPIGISFHIFQSISYTIEVYKRRFEPVRHFGKFALYVSFFPQLVAGPIERPQGLLSQIMNDGGFDLQKAKSGARLMAWGYFKKVVIADNLAPVVNAVYANPSAFPGPSLALATMLFAYQIYCDFSGYTDIARGAARFYGYELMLNFDRPFKAKTLADFWRRWHISLSSWLREYLYLPLALSGKHHSRLKIYMSLCITFVLIGLWHGANWTYVFFGAIHGVYLIIGLLTAKVRARIQAPAFLKITTVFLLVCITYIFFRAPNVHEAFYILLHIPTQISSFVQALLSPEGRAHVLAMDTAWHGLVVGLLGIGVLEIVEYLQTYKNLTWHIAQIPWIPRAALYAGVVTIILLFGAFGHEQFIYFQF